MATSTDTPRLSLVVRLWRALVRLTVLSVVLALAGAALVLLSRLNARTFSLAVEGDRLIVLKGKELPTGTEPWRPVDVTLADTYAPIDLHGMPMPTLVGARFEDKDALDRALFTALELLARPRVASDDPRMLDDGATYLRRARRLPGLTEDQQATLAKLETEVSFYLARTRLEDSRLKVEEALEQLKRAASTDSRHQRQANQMLLVVEPQAKAFSDALRSAVHQLSQPASANAPAPAPAANDAGAP